MFVSVFVFVFVSPTEAWSIRASEGWGFKSVEELDYIAMCYKLSKRPSMHLWKHLVAIYIALEDITRRTIYAFMEAFCSNIAMCYKDITRHLWKPV